MRELLEKKRPSWKARPAPMPSPMPSPTPRVKPKPMPSPTKPFPRDFKNLTPAQKKRLIDILTAYKKKAVSAKKGGRITKKKGGRVR